MHTRVCARAHVRVYTYVTVCERGRGRVCWSHTYLAALQMDFAFALPPLSPWNGLVFSHPLNAY